ncbi:MAG: O-antigen ligase family protein [Candidatus Shapirobacteria bacterium]|nr:O-antigen ligase family protein [Candidatus Shapirobacteria bacterium]
MAFVQTIIFGFVCFSFFIGQIFRLNLFGINFPLIDISIIAFSLYNFIIQLKQHNLKNKNKFLAYFLVYAWFLLGITLLRYQFYSLKPFFYLVRLTCLISFFIFPPKIIQKFKNLFYLSIIANIIFGLIQYFFWPDFTYFDIINWDPHLYRLVSTYFDPTFTGLIYLLFIIKLFLDKKTPYRWPLLIISYLTLALTYSRSTLLSLIFVSGFIGWKNKKISIFLSSLLLVLATILLLPRQAGEGTKLERTSSITAKIENYQEGLSLFKQYPIFGIGYNNIPFFKKTTNEMSHSNSGFDSSLLTILISTGIIGGVLFTIGFKKIFIQSNLIIQSCLVGIFIHSLFANSLLYPWILLALVFI